MKKSNAEVLREVFAHELATELKTPEEKSGGKPHFDMNRFLFSVTMGIPMLLLVAVAAHAGGLISDNDLFVQIVFGIIVVFQYLLASTAVINALALHRAHRNVTAKCPMLMKRLDDTREVFWDRLDADQEEYNTRGYSKKKAA